MINRVLIRMKVVQLLYSYLLIENHFMLESQPSSPTKEKRFAYNLYLDILYLAVCISSRVEKRGGERPLADTRFIKKILADEKIRSLEKKYRNEPFPFEPAVSSLVEKIKESGLYKNYLKDTQTGVAENDQIWENIINLIVFPDPILGRLISERENYTLGGVDRMKTMMAETFKNFYASRDNIDDALKELSASMEKSRELYFRLLLLPVEICALRERQLEDNRFKYIPTAEDLNPNTRFVENGLAKAIAENDEVVRYCEETKTSWFNGHTELLESLLKTIMESDIYEEYMSFPATDYITDCTFWRNVFKHIILNNEDFLEALETESVFWNDDLEIISTFVLKTLKRFEDLSQDSNPVLPKFKDKEDATFGASLLSDVIRKKDTYRLYIENCINSNSWDSERMAFMDVVITMTGLAEILNFPKIPLSVSFNEYIEIAKSYSTHKSGAFVNGLLKGIVEKLRAENKINK